MAAPGPIAGPTGLTVYYDALDSVTVSWASSGIDAVGYDLTYVDEGGSEQTIALAPTERHTRLYDIGYSAGTVSVRARFNDDLVSEPSETQVLRGSVANLSAAIALVEADPRYAPTELVTLNSRTALADSIAAAQALVANGATPAQVLAANTAMNRAATGIVNYSVVPQYIADFEAMDVSGFTPGSRARFAAALAAARQLAEAAATDPGAVITSEQIETTVNAVRTAYDSALASPERLASLLEQAQSLVDGADRELYTGYSVRAIQSSIAAAITALDDTEPTVEALDAATESLQAALDSRVERPSALRAAFAAFATLGADRSGFTGASARDVSSAHAAAVAADDADTDLSTLATAGTALSATIAALVSVDTLLDALAVNDVSLLVPLDYTSATWAVFARAYAASVEFLALATATEAAPVTELALSAQADSLRAARLALAKPTPFATSGITFLPTPAGPPVPAAQLPPGLYVQVLDGMITMHNSGGSLNFTAGQFGYVPSPTRPPVVVPSNPNLQFTPPPAFSAPTTTISAPSTGSVDCEVRRVRAGDVVDVTGTGVVVTHPTDVPPTTAPVIATRPTDSATRPKTYCNRLAAPPAGARMASTMADASNTMSAEAAPAYQIVSVLPPTYPAAGNVSVSFALPADAERGDLFLQFTYNGVYVETVASVEITPGSEIPTVTVAGTSTTPAAVSARGRLAATGTDPGALVGTAALLLFVGVALVVSPAARRRHRTA